MTKVGLRQVAWIIEEITKAREIVELSHDHDVFVQLREFQIKTIYSDLRENLPKVN